MKRKHTPDNKGSRKNRPHQGMSKGSSDTKFKAELFAIMKDNFRSRIEGPEFQAQDLNKTGTVKSFLYNGKKYVAIRGDNDLDAHVYDGKMYDLKSRYGAVLKGYKLLYNKIIDLYYPEQPPYELKFPQIFITGHDRYNEAAVIERIDDLVTFEDIDLQRVNIPKEHIPAINQFCNDRNRVVFQLSSETKGNKGDIIYKDFIIAMPYGHVLVRDDFGSRPNLNGGTPGAENFKNVAYALSSKEKPILYLVDALVSLDMKRKPVKKKRVSD